MSKRSFEYISGTRGFKENAYHDRSSFLPPPSLKTSRWGPENPTPQAWLPNQDSVHYNRSPPPAAAVCSPNVEEQETVNEDRRSKNFHRERYYPVNRLPTGKFVGSRTVGEDFRERREEEARNQLPPKVTVAQPGANTSIFKVLPPKRPGQGVASDHVVIPLATFGSETGKRRVVDIHPEQFMEDAQNDRDDEAESSRQMKQEILESFIYRNKPSTTTNGVNSSRVVDSPVSRLPKDLDVNSSSSSETIMNASTNLPSSSSNTDFQIKREPVDECLENNNTNVMQSFSNGFASGNYPNQSNNVVLQQLLDQWNQMAYQLNVLTENLVQLRNAFEQCTPVLCSLLQQNSP
uniref:Uncharacterized protein n=1 Tax=Panagrolaimus sp. JU765 TaxID=591449 RepID=A0AC34R160_9BILA